MKPAFIKTISGIASMEIGSINLENRTLEYSNGYAEKVLGYTKAEINSFAKDDFVAIVHPDDKPLIKRNLDRLFSASNGEIFESHIRLRKKSGDYVYWYIRESVYQWNSEGIPSKIATILEDRSHVLQLETDLGIYLKKLKDISYKNSHDLRGPVSNIIGIVNHLNEEDFKCPRTKKIFDYLEEAVIKLDNVIREINEEANN